MAQQGAFAYFKYIIIVQLFFGMSISLIAYAMPSDTQEYINLIQPEHSVDPGDITSQIQGSMQSQMNIPLIDLGALVFYSGNIVVDMILNTIFAIPELVTIVFDVFLGFFAIDAYVATTAKLVLWAIISVIYIIAILAFIMSIRSGSQIV